MFHILKGNKNIRIFTGTPVSLIINPDNQSIVACSHPILNA